MEVQGKEEKKISTESELSEAKEKQNLADKDGSPEGEKRKEQKRVLIILLLVCLMAALSFFLPKALVHIVPDKASLKQRLLLRILRVLIQSP